MKKNAYEKIGIALEDLLEKCHHIDENRMTETFTALLKFDEMLRKGGVALYVTSVTSCDKGSNGNNMTEFEGRIYLTQNVSWVGQERRYHEDCLAYHPYLHFHYVDTSGYWAYVEYAYVPGEKAFYREWSWSRMNDACGNKPEAKKEYGDLVALRELHMLFYTLWSRKAAKQKIGNIDEMIGDWKINRCMLMPV